ncbi:cyclophane-forming radical SAM/SPASM peptide maturase GrrM/OscB [Pseudophaeobacter sp. 1A16562]|uniref:cyclophane-forming radical SAM/SPASM peptide maturase GrrM/OscB n=1 Tax=Pseudophaeobacter sp. 1A16562 TaxID=3098143 RepID=UPI0034D3ED30
MVQSTRFCNIDCSYCYLPFRTQKSRFDTTFFAPLFEALQRAGLLDRQLTVLWHAGEPLALPAEFYQEAFEELARLCPDGLDLMHHVQTNAMLLSDAHLDLFQEWNVQIGVSIDGPDWIHDKNRLTRSGKGSHAAAMKGIAKLRARNIPFTCIAVLTADALSYPDEIYDFFKSLRCYNVGFNIDEEEAINDTSSMAADGVQQAYAAFLKQIHNRIRNDPHPLGVREFENVSQSLGGWFAREAPNCTESNPLSILSIDAEGYLYTFSPEFVDVASERYADFKIGHARDIVFEKLYETEPFASLNRDIKEGVFNCRQSCSYFDVCGGGVPSNKFFELGELAGTETNFCRLTRKTLVDTVHDIMAEAHQARRDALQR